MSKAIMLEPDPHSGINAMLQAAFIQDSGSLEVAPLLDRPPEQRIIRSCGRKSLMTPWGGIGPGAV